MYRIYIYCICYIPPVGTYTRFVHYYIEASDCVTTAATETTLKLQTNNSDTRMAYSYIMHAAVSRLYRVMHIMSIL